ncbi:hypothetical protein BDR26DRAFT_855099 [Obelidium mucronatum]|nr:hypothetical protein BDR26DRAFT_855099 [Obelidium mucronatum]
MFPPRTDMDFTDRMWSFCSGATSYEDLSKTIKLISNCSSNGTISKQNTTKLASIVRDCLKFTRTNISASYSQQQESLFSVLDAFVQSPLEYLVEIGITKLKRDYCFSSNHSTHSLDPSLSLSDQINRLCELHQTLEIWSLPHVNVPGGFPHSCARTLVILALRYFQDGWKNEKFNGKQGGTLFEQSSTAVPIEFNVVLPRYQADVAKLVESVCQMQVTLLFYLNYLFVLMC